MGSAWRLPGYRVERLLGAGGFGEVWRATVRATGAPVALKRVRLTDASQREAAVAEAAVLGALDHPNLIHLHRLERVDDAIVLVLDLAAGGSLAALLGARGRLTPGETISALAPIAGALASAHVAGVVHGDVTPANILFSELGLPLLADLGVSRLTGDRKPVHTTLPYADPVVAQGYPPDETSDVYMLGAVALHTLTGHPPPSGVGQLDAPAWSARVAARLATADVPPAMAAVVGRAMSLDPDLRRGAAEFALDLRAAGIPVAVELAAGRARVEPSLARLAALATGGRPGALPSGREASAALAGGAAAAGPAPGAPPLTHGARLPSPMPAARHRVRRTGFGRRTVPSARSVRLVLAAVAVLILVGGTGVLGRLSARSAAAPERTVGEPVATRDPSPQPVPTAPAVLTAATVLTELRQLDAVRAEAFAARDPGILARVYAARTLVDRDRAMLTALVPPGCHLRGVRTRFGAPRLVHADAAAVDLTVPAQLLPSRLWCGGRPAGAAPGTRPTDLAVRLTRTAQGWRISSQHPVAAATG